jgi:ribonuclease HI
MAKFFTDGSSVIGVKSSYCVTDGNGKILDIKETSPYKFSSNEEEYRGVIEALNLCNDGDEVFTDSLLVVNQVSGIYKVKKDHLKSLCEQVKDLLKSKPNTKLIWISREENLAGKHFE